MFTFAYANKLENIEATLKSYPNASYLVLETKNFVELEKSGNYSESSYERIQILTEDAKKQLSSMKYYYHATYTPIQKLNVKVFMPDGSVKEIPQADIVDSTDPRSQSKNIYQPKKRLKTVTLGDLPIGTIIETKKVTLGKQLVKNGFINIHLLQGNEPILFSEIKIHIPDGMYLNYVLNGKEKVSFTENKIKNGTELIWQAKNMPAIIREPYMPDFENVAQSIYFTTFKTWEDASKYYYDLNKDNYKANDAIKTKVKELTENLKTNEEKVLAIHRFVVKNIRYLGSSMDENAFFETHEASYTFEKGHGICRDKALLMTTMLRLIGIDCYDMLINPSFETDPNLPTLYFEHAVCVIKLNGQMIVMDPTDEMSRELGAEYAGDRYGLYISEWGSDIYKIPATPSDTNLGKFSYSGTLNNDLKLSTDLKVSGTGRHEIYSRKFKNNCTDDVFAIALEKYASTISPSAIVSNITSGNPEDLDNPFNFSFKITTDDYGIQAGKYHLISFPGLSSPFDLELLKIIASASSLQTRKYDISFSAPRTYEIEDTLTIPDGYKVISLPNNLKLSDGFISVDLKFNQSGNNVVFKGKYSIENRTIPAEHYKSFKSIAETIKKSSKK